MNSIKSLLIAGLLTILTLFGCEKEKVEDEEPEDEWENAKKQEKINRDAYIQSLENDGYTVVEEDGIYYDEELRLPDYADSISIEPDDSVYIRFSSYYVLEDTLILFESNASNDEPLKFEYSDTTNAPEGFLTALDTMYTGTIAKVLTPFKQGYEEAGLRDPVYNYIIVPEYTSIVYDIEIENVIKP